MTFLAPIAGLIAGAVALPLLVALYFLRLRRRPVRVSSVILWEQAARDMQANVPLQWIKPSWLLLLQALAVALLAAALARPAIDVQGPQAARVILVIDASASMSALADPAAGLAPGATRLDEAKARAIEIIDRSRRAASGDDAAASGASRVAVVAFAAAPRLVTGFTTDRALLRRAVEAIEPTDQPADLDAALRLIEGQTAPADESPLPVLTRVVLLSDGAFPPDQRPQAGVGDAEFAFVRVGPPPDAPRDNLGVVAISARRDFDDPELVRLFARLVNTNPRAVEAPVTVRLNAAAVRSQVVRVPAAGADAPGETPVTFDFRDAAGGVLAVSIERSDELPADNDGALLLAPAAPARALLVAPGDGGAAPDAFLVRALEETIGAPLTILTGQQYSARVQDPAWAAGFDLVVFDRVEPDAPPPSSTLSFASAAGAEGVSFSTAAPAAARFASWRRTHPLMRHVGLDQVVLAGAPIIVFAGGEDAGARFTPLALGRDGPLIALLEDGRVRRVIVSFDTQRSTWPLQVSFAVFIANVVTNLSPAGASAEARGATTGAPVTLRPLPGVERVRATGPATISAPVRPGAAGVGLGVPVRAGLYRVEGVIEDDALLPVNLVNAGESAIATRDEVAVGAGTTGATGVGAAAPREVWHWFVLAALALLTLEWLLYARCMRA